MILYNKSRNPLYITIDSETKYIIPGNTFEIRDSELDSNEYIKKLVEKKDLVVWDKKESSKKSKKESKKSKKSGVTQDTFDVNIDTLDKEYKEELNG